MGYWGTVAKSAWHETRLFTPIKAVPSIIFAGYQAWYREASTISQWAGISCALFMVYVLLAVIEFFLKLLVVAPMRVHREAQAENEQLRKELKDLLKPSLEILFEPNYPYDDQRRRGPTQNEDYRLFRIGVRNNGIKTVTGLKVQISDVKPRPERLFTPLLLPAMHDRPNQTVTELNPNDAPWYFDVVDQRANGEICIAHTVQGIERLISPRKYILTINASGCDVPAKSRQFVISVPTPRQGNQDLQFTPLDWLLSLVC
jgi:hypothetical protein